MTNLDQTGPKHVKISARMHRALKLWCVANGIEMTNAGSLAVYEFLTKRKDGDFALDLGRAPEVEEIDLDIFEHRESA